MKWRVEIRTFDAEALTHGNVVDEIESTDLKAVIQWWNERWMNKRADHSLQVYANNKELKFEQIYDLGFFDKMKIKK